MGNVVNAVELAHRHMEEMPDQREVMMLLWVLHEMDAFRDYSMKNYLRRGLEPYAGDRNKMLREISGKDLANLLEEWAWQIREFLEAPEESGGGESGGGESGGDMLGAE